jgi:NACalpha-BTF3-like transcription factor
LNSIAAQKQSSATLDVLGPSKTHSEEDEIASKDVALSMMMEETKEDREVCYFYLESSNWDLNAAIMLMKSMKA